MGIDFFKIDTVAQGILFQSCYFNHRKSSSSNAQQLNRIKASQTKNEIAVNPKEKIPFRQFPDFDSNDEDDDDDNGTDDDDDADDDADELDLESEDDERLPKSKLIAAKKTVKRKAKKRPVAKVSTAKKTSKSKPEPTPFRLEHSRVHVPFASPNRNTEPSAMRKTIKSNNQKIFNAPISNAPISTTPISTNKPVETSRGLIRGVFHGTADIVGLIKEGLDTAASSTSNYIYGTRVNK